jgi:hypothetical protein
MLVYVFLSVYNERLDSEIMYGRYFDYYYFGFKLLDISYLLKLTRVVVERPWYMLMMVFLRMTLNLLLGFII